MEWFMIYVLIVVAGGMFGVGYEIGKKVMLDKIKSREVK